MNPKNDSPKPGPELIPGSEDGATNGGANEGSAADLRRRRFLAKVSLTLGVVGGTALSVPGVVFVVAPLFRDSPSVWRSLGKVASFQIGSTVSVVFLDASPLPWAGVTAKSAAWLRRTAEQEFVAFSVNCAHLGCPVRWLEGARLFMCPCHGGVYYEDGRVAAGPPPHDLTRYPIRIRDGEVEISTQPIPIG
jgi:menaquinol-cytochrome c reductase iron-sulfur subunit